MKYLNLHISAKALLCWYVFIFLSTEFLSFFHLLERNYIFLAELFFWVFFLYHQRLEILQTVHKINFRSKSVFLIITLFLLTFIQGFFSAPNSTDSMVYHLPRVMYWIQEKTLFQDVVRNVHDYLPPFGQYILLHLYLIFGNDSFLFFSQWFAYVVTVIISGVIAGSLGANKQVSRYTSLLVACLPVALMQASGTKIDLIVTGLVVICTYMVLNLKEEKFWDYIALGFGFGLGSLTKQTFLLYALIPSTILLVKLLRSNKRYLFFVPLVFTIFLVVQARFISQNLLLYGNASGSKEDYAGLAIQDISLKGVSSNLIKNTMLHIPIPIYTKQAEDLILYIHKLLGIDVNDCSTTFCDPDFRFKITRFIYPQEDIAANTFHLLLITTAGVMLLWQLIKGRLSFLESFIYGLAILSYVAFSTFLKWQPFHSRLHMPFFVIGTIISVLILSKFKKGVFFLKVVLALSVFLALALIFLNVTRPYVSYNLFYESIKSFAPSLSGIPESFFVKPYEQQYFNTRSYWYKPYKTIIEDINKAQLISKTTISFQLMDIFEYPLWAFIKRYHLNLKVVPESKTSNKTIIISTSKDPYSKDGYTTSCIKTEVEYGYACISMPN